jgi:hypothetical protein
LRRGRLRKTWKRIVQGEAKRLSTEKDRKVLQAPYVPEGTIGMRMNNVLTGRN